MNIIVNDVQIDFTLEHESTIGEVFSQLDRWLRENGHVVDEISIDGVSHDSGNGDWHSAPVTGVETLAITARSLREAELNDIDTIHQYLDLLRRVLSSGTDDQLSDVLSEYAFVRESLPRFAPSAGEVLDRALENVTVQTGVNAVQTIVSVLSILEERRRELLEPDREVRATATALRASLPAVEDVPAHLQTGQDAQAMQSITAFTELIGKLLRILPLVLEIHPALNETQIDERTVDEFIEGLNATLTEVVDAFHREDFVLLGDLMEYEIVPRAHALLDHLERVE